MEDLFAPRRSRASKMPCLIDAERWLTHLSSSQAAGQGGVVRGKARAVERIVGWGLFRAERKRRGYRAALNSGQVAVFCNAEPVQIFE